MSKTPNTPASAPETLLRAPLANLKIAPENARGRNWPKADDQLEPLALSINTLGRVIDPLHAYPEGKDFMIWDGGRRLASLEMMARRGAKEPQFVLPQDLVENGVPILVCADKATARLLSLATFNRAAMHPADEFLAYRDMFKDGKGMTPDQIAAACAVETPRVRKLLRLCGVHDEIIAAFKDGKISMDVVVGFTLTTDQDKQLAVWKGQKGKKEVEAYEVKRLLRAGAISSGDPVAMMVGRDAYEKAGGTFLQDLFQGRDDESWADGALAQRLANERVEALIAKHLAEGWSWVKFSDRNDWSYDRNVRQLPKPPGGKWDKDTMAKAGVFVKQQHNGTIDVQRGWTTPAKAASAKGEAPAVKKPQQAEPAMYGFGHKGHEMLTEVATQATRVALLRQPDAAYDALLTHLAYLSFGPEHGVEEGTACRLMPAQRWGNAPPVQVEGGSELTSAFTAWHERLHPAWKDRVAFCDEVAALTAAEKAQLLALCFALSLDGREQKIDYRKPTRWAHLGWIAAHAKVDPVKAWMPDAEFLKGANRDALDDAVKTMGGPSMSDAKKGALVKFVADKAPEKGWRPQLLATFTDLPPVKPKANRVQKAVEAAAAVVGVEAAADAAGLASEEFSPELRALAGAGAPKPIKDGSDDT